MLKSILSVCIESLHDCVDNFCCICGFESINSPIRLKLNDFSCHNWSSCSDNFWCWNCNSVSRCCYNCSSSIHGFNVFWSCNFCLKICEQFIQLKSWNWIIITFKCIEHFIEVIIWNWLEAWVLADGITNNTELKLFKSTWGVFVNLGEDGINCILYWIKL